MARLESGTARGGGSPREDPRGWLRGRRRGRPRAQGSTRRRHRPALRTRGQESRIVHCQAPAEHGTAALPAFQNRPLDDRQPASQPSRQTQGQGRRHARTADKASFRLSPGHAWGATGVSQNMESCRAPAQVFVAKASPMMPTATAGRDSHAAALQLTPKPSDIQSTGFRKQ